MKNVKSDDWCESVCEWEYNLKCPFFECVEQWNERKNKFDLFKDICRFRILLN